MGNESELQIVLRAKDELTKELSKVRSELKSLESDMKTVQTQTKSAGTQAKNSFSLFGKHVDTADEKAKTLVGTLGGLGKLRLFGAIGGFLAIRQLGFFFAESAKEAGVQEQAVAQLNAVLQSTGRASEISAQSMTKLASSLQQVTTFGDEAILSAENILLTFTNIGQNVIPQATETVLDMAQALDQDLKQTAIQVGKALQDPILGVGALRRVGVNFTEDQKDMIEALVDSGKVLEAQEAILAELTTEFGGSARAAALTYTGQIEQMKNNFGDLKEVIGSALLPSITEVTGEINRSIMSVGGASNAAAQWGEILFRLTNIITGLIKSFVIGVKLTLLPAVQVLIGALQIVWASFKRVGNIIGSVGKSFVQFVKGDYQDAVDTLKNSFTDDSFSKDMANIFNEHFAVLKDNLDGLPDLADSVWEDFKQAFTGEGFQAVIPDIKLPTLQGLGDNGLTSDLKEAEEASNQFESSMKSILSIFEKTNTGLEKFAEKWQSAKDSASESITEIRNNTKSKLLEIKTSISEVVSEMASLQEEFNATAQSDKNDLASQFVDAEEKIKDLKDELARATDAQNILDIKSQIQEQEDALTATADVQKGLADEIAQAREKASMSELEQAIYDYNEKRNLAQQELNQKLADLQAEKSALRDQADYEKEIRDEAIEKVREELAEKKKALAEEQKEFLKKITNDILAESSKSEIVKQIVEQAESFKQNIMEQSHEMVKESIEEEIDLFKELRKAILSAYSAREGSKVSVDDAIITPSGQVIKTNPKDYIIATQNPSSLVGSGSGTVVNINGGTYLSEDVAESIGDMIINRLQSQLRI